MGVVLSGARIGKIEETMIGVFGGGRGINVGAVVRWFHLAGPTS